MTLSKKIQGFLFLCFLVALAMPQFAQGQSSKAYKKAIKKHRKAYKKKFLTNEHSPLDKKGVKKLSFFKADESYQSTCSFERSPDAKPFEMATYSGVTQPYRQYGVATCPVNGQDIQLAIYQSLQLIRMPMYRDYLFIPFKDDTNSASTYGGGRYMDISLKDIENKAVVLDFNKAYNPYCAYSDGYSCPIPPTENHLEMKILAGEKAYESND